MDKYYNFPSGIKLCMKHRITFKEQCSKCLSEETPSFPLETKKEPLQGVSPPIPPLLPNATSSPLNREHDTPPIPPPFFFWRPNNYRLVVNYNGHLSGRHGTYSKANGLTYWRHGAVTLQVSKRLITGIWSQGRSRKTWKIHYDSVNALEDDLNAVKSKIRLQIVESIMAFAKLESLSLIGDFRWSRHEDWIKGEDYIDKIPQDLIIHDTVFKKVYGEGVEFIGSTSEPTGEVKQYIKNRVVESFAPAINETMQEVAKSFRLVADEALNPLTHQIKLHLKVQRETLKNLKKMSKSLDKFNVPQRFVPPEGEGGVLVHQVTPLHASSDTPPSYSKEYRQFRARELLKEYGW